MENGGVVGAQTSKPCRRCKVHLSTRKIRTEPVCDDCFCKYIVTKAVKRLEVLGKETRTQGSRPSKRKYLVGLSLGVSSAALVGIAEQLIANQTDKGRDPPFEVHAVHVDADHAAGSSESAALLEQWRTRFPRFTFESVPLSTVVGLDTIDWTALPPSGQESQPAPQRIRDILDALPSPTSRADVQRLFVRQVLLHLTAKGAYDALLLGNSTTALAELTLAETAKGRGFSLPWQTNDGPQTLRHYGRPVGGEGEKAGEDETVTVYYPVRELFRKELVTYTGLVSPTMEDLRLPEAAPGSAVVSHRDISIEEVMRRYFEDVEENYPSVVANVVRTTAKLSRQDSAAGLCSFCSTPLDEQGDERWRGEIGDWDHDESGTTISRGSLCYGCKRTFRG